MRFCLHTIILLAALGVSSAWNAPPSPYQYHIQTDEGPERYFRYQTDSGQFRKEKRLADGTVIGTDAWVDDSGYLRMRDYIADGQGYRILKSKTVFVGRGRPIQEAIKSTKTVSPQSGVLVNPGAPASSPAKTFQAVTSLPQTTPAPIASIYPTPSPIGSLYPTPPPSSPSLYSTPAPVIPLYSTPPSLGYLYSSAPKEPVVEVSPNSIPFSTLYAPTTPSTPLYSTTITNNIKSTTEIESSTVRPISSTTLPPNYTPIIAPISSTSLRPEIPSSTPPSISSSSTAIPPSVEPLLPPTSSSYPQINSNSVEQGYQYNNQQPFQHQYYQQYNPYFNNPFLSPNRGQNYQSVPQNTPKYNFNNVGQQNGYNYNQIGNGYDPQYPLYDGIAVTNNGFRYYLPRQYHEEENSGSDTRSGSFGYVDPFGIRRVIYYNTAPGTGFVHKKNNRYVGLNGTPYDPRPL